MISRVTAAVTMSELSEGTGKFCWVGSGLGFGSECTDVLLAQVPNLVHHSDGGRIVTVNIKLSLIIVR
jgi:hypothetical protein